MSRPTSTRHELLLFLRPPPTRSAFQISFPRAGFTYFFLINVVEIKCRYQQEPSYLRHHFSSLITLHH